MKSHLHITSSSPEPLYMYYFICLSQELCKIDEPRTHIHIFQMRKPRAKKVKESDWTTQLVRSNIRRSLVFFSLYFDVTLM